VKIFGDLPIYVAPDSVATWSSPKVFQLDERQRATAVAGVPPDYFSEDGQLWGNPLYDWDEQRRDGFAFWMQRLAQQADRFDLLRIELEVPFEGARHPAWLYIAHQSPHRATPRVHEVIAPYIDLQAHTELAVVLQQPCVLLPYGPNLTCVVA